MEVLHLFGTAEQKKRWLDPLLAGEIRSAFAMTEPDVASSDATNIETSIVRDGGDYVVNGRKWWITGVADERCEIYIVMGKSAPHAEPYRRQSMILVPRDTPGVRSSGTCPSSATRISTGIPNSSSITPGSRRPTCWRPTATASPSPRPGSVPGGYITPCGPSGWRSGRSR